MSSDKLNNTNREFKTLQNSFEDWDADMPSPEVWENLDADLAVSAVWDRLDESLDANGSPADQSLIDAYENWSPNSYGDGWSKLDEQLSRERVWKRLNTTLSYPVTTRIPWLKMAAASVVFVFLAFYTDHPFMTDGGVSGTAFGDGAKTASTEPENRNTALVYGADDMTSVDRDQVGTENRKANQFTQDAPDPNRLVVLDNNTNPDIGLGVHRNPDENRLNERVSNVDMETGTTTDSSVNDLAFFDMLPARGITDFSEPGTIRDFEFLPFNSAFKPKFSILFGGQFAFINENNERAFSSSLPSMGIAADLQYHTYLKKLRFTQDLGFSQYAQSKGGYVNGQYMSCNQKLNTVHLVSSVGYSLRNGVTVHAGVAVSRLLNGYEESRTAITNVYNSKKLQIGATAGIDYHFMPFKNKTAMGVGVQYQFVSKLKSQNTVFNDIQGVKLQIKYSF